MPSRDVNAATRLAEASWRRDNVQDRVHNSFVNSGTSIFHVPSLNAVMLKW